MLSKIKNLCVFLFIALFFLSACGGSSGGGGGDDEDGANSTVSSTIEVTGGTWYIRVQAYSALNDGSYSELSSEQSITVSGDSSTSKNIIVSWTPNREKAVNSEGGGYKIYYSTTSGFSESDTGVYVKDVPFESAR